MSVNRNVTVPDGGYADTAGLCSVPSGPIAGCGGSKTLWQPLRSFGRNAVLDQVDVRDSHVVEAVYREPFGVLIFVPKFEYRRVWWR